jgi:hypothetical protein
MEDAELIRMCDRMVAIQAEERRLCRGPDVPSFPGDDPVIGPQLDALDVEYQGILGRLAPMVPATLAGVRALARVALALAEIADDRELALRPALVWLASDDDGASAWTPPAPQTATAMPTMGRA